MKTLRIALLITGVLIACLALNTTFAQSAPPADSAAIINHYHDPKPKHKETHKDKTKSEKATRKETKEKSKPEKEKNKDKSDSK